MNAKYIVGSALMMACPAMAKHESGSLPETDFEYTRAAINTILGDENVVKNLRFKGGISLIAPVDDRRDVFTIKTDKCILRVQFIRSCQFPNGGLPQCSYEASVLPVESVSDCAP